MIKLVDIHQKLLICRNSNVHEGSMEDWLNWLTLHYTKWSKFLSTVQLVVCTYVTFVHGAPNAPLPLAQLKSQDGTLSVGIWLADQDHIESSSCLDSWVQSLQVLFPLPIPVLPNYSKVYLIHTITSCINSSAIGGSLFNLARHVYLDDTKHLSIIISLGGSSFLKYPGPGFSSQESIGGTAL